MQQKVTVVLYEIMIMLFIRTFYCTFARYMSNLIICATVGFTFIYKLKKINFFTQRVNLNSRLHVPVWQLQKWQTKKWGPFWSSWTSPGLSCVGWWSGHLRSAKRAGSQIKHDGRSTMDLFFPILLAVCFTDLSLLDWPECRATHASCGSEHQLFFFWICLLSPDGSMMSRETGCS